MTFSGSIVKRSFDPFPSRTVSCFMPKSKSCTRSRKASDSRSPLPYSSQRDIPPDPVAIRRLGANRIVLEPHHLPNLIQQLELRIRRDQVPVPNHGRQTATAVQTVEKGCLELRKRG